METPGLTTEGFWSAPDPLVMVNPLDTTAAREAVEIRAWITHQPALAAHLLFRTSGSSGKGKWVALSKSALLESARAVNGFLEVTADDRWLQSLPLFHVGGIGIAARAYAAGCAVAEGLGKWDADHCHRLLTVEKITLASLVPAQLADLVRLEKKSPEHLRAVVIGGGRLDDGTYQKATALGWPVRESYGMTETCSQIATADAGTRELRLLPGLEVAGHPGGCLQVRGNTLLTGYVGCGEGGCFLKDPKQDGWFVTNDRGTVSGDCLTIHGRADRCVKILGELVDLNEVEQSIYHEMEQTGHAHQSLAVVAVAPPESGAHEEKRRGALLVVCVENNDHFHRVVERYNAHCHPLHRIMGVALLESLPRTGIGKISYPELEGLLKSER